MHVNVVLVFGDHTYIFLTLAVLLDLTNAIFVDPTSDRKYINKIKKTQAEVLYNAK